MELEPILPYARHNGEIKMTQEPQNINDLWPSKWLRAIDLDKGKIVTITHQRIEMKKKFQSKETEAKLILSFKNGTKELICTKTQAREIAELTGSETFADWPGTKVLLKPKLLPIGKYTIEFCLLPDYGAYTTEETIELISDTSGEEEQIRDGKRDLDDELPF